jgi:hypothetical protein
MLNLPSSDDGSEKSSYSRNLKDFIQNLSVSESSGSYTISSKQSNISSPSQHSNQPHFVVQEEKNTLNKVVALNISFLGSVTPSVPEPKSEVI